VHRLGPGAVVEIFDGVGCARRAEVTSLGRGWVELCALGATLPDRVAPCRLTLATAVPKGDRFDWLVEKATELGVYRLSPIVTERSVVDPRPAKLERLRRRIIEAAKQCGRNRLMLLDAPVSWAQWIALTETAAPTDPAGPRLLAHPEGAPSACWPRAQCGREAVLAIGPEGGFTENEVEAARGAGWHVAGLGATRLRVETAALAGCAVILALCEDMAG
jgi:16S rRNA (uracil1498-N3)-methyltransferase